MGVFNGEKHLSRAIESILNQTYKDFEFIICDDFSSDNSRSKIEEYAAQDDRIVFLKNKSNLGLAATLNRCIEVSKGNYIARMDDDDISLPERFEKQIRFFEKNTSYAIIGGAINLYDEHGVFGKRIPKERPNKIRIFKGSAFIHPTVMIKKSALIEVKGYTVANHTRRTEDYDLWCKLTLAEYVGYNLQEVVLNYFEGKDSYKKRKLKHRIDSIKLRSLWWKKLNIPTGVYLKTIIRLIISGLLPNVIIRKYHILLNKKS